MFLLNFYLVKNHIFQTRLFETTYLVPSCRIPIPVIRTMFDKESYYVAQVTAHARDANMERSFVMIEHNGMSEPLTFRFKKDTDKSELKPLIESKEESASSPSSEGNESDE